MHQHVAQVVRDEGVTLAVAATEQRRVRDKILQSQVDADNTLEVAAVDDRERCGGDDAQARRIKVRRRVHHCLVLGGVGEERVVPAHGGAQVTAVGDREVCSRVLLGHVAQQRPDVGIAQQERQQADRVVGVAPVEQIEDVRVVVRRLTVGKEQDGLVTARVSVHARLQEVEGLVQRGDVASATVGGDAGVDEALELGNVLGRRHGHSVVEAALRGACNRVELDQGHVVARVERGQHHLCRLLGLGHARAFHGSG
mmetsp:Transcript_165864/g.403053  ORF Transcript_165864/g.403053 Transcript_165864/m.403053 type:complete len:255 (-) Transcript_165864:780-1544(-)